MRIIRAVRFAAKLSPLGFTLSTPRFAAPLVQSQALLADVPQSRMFDEMLKLLQTGHAIATIEQLRKLAWPGAFTPAGRGCGAGRHAVCEGGLMDTDRRVQEGKPVAPSFLLACVLWEDVRKGWDERLNRREHALPALQDAIDEVFDRRIGDVSGRGKLAADMREIWVMQPRF